MTKYSGSFMYDIQAQVNQIFDKYIHRGCGKPFELCECSEYGDEWKAELEDDPARGAR